MPGEPLITTTGDIFGVSAGDRIAQTQSAHAIRDAHCADAVQPGVGVGGEPGAIFRVQPITRMGLFSNCA